MNRYTGPADTFAAYTNELLKKDQRIEALEAERVLLRGVLADCAAWIELCNEYITPLCAREARRLLDNKQP